MIVSQRIFIMFLPSFLLELYCLPISGSLKIMRIFILHTSYTLQIFRVCPIVPLKSYTALLHPIRVPYVSILSIENFMTLNVDIRSSDSVIILLLKGSALYGQIKWIKLSYIQKSQNDNTIYNTNDSNYNFYCVMLIVLYSIFHLSLKTTL